MIKSWKIFSTIAGSTGLITATSIICPKFLQVSQKKIIMSCLGDSLTYESRYELYVASKLNIRYPLNLGKNGSTITNMPGRGCFAYRYKYIPKASDIIIVDGGYNDFNHNAPLGQSTDNNPITFYGALNMLFDGLVRGYNHSGIFFMTPFHYSDRAQSMEKYINAIKMKCEQYNLPCFDLFNDAPFDFDYQKDTYDGIHPTNAFTKNVWVPAIVDFIKENYQKK